MGVQSVFSSMRIRNYSSPIFIAFGCCHYGYAQEAVDSLLKKLAGATKDSNKVLLLIKMGEAYENNVQAEAHMYYYQDVWQ